MPQLGRQVRLSDESPAIVLVSGHIGAQNLEGVSAGQAWVLGEIDLAHSSGPEQLDDGVPRKHITGTQRHGPNRTEGFAVAAQVGEPLGWACRPPAGRSSVEPYRLDRHRRRGPAVLAAAG